MVELTLRLCTVKPMIKILFHAVLFVFLTIITQVGGIAWLLALRFRSRLLVFIAIYAAVSVSTIYIAPTMGRVPLPCWSDGPLQPQSALYCVLNRYYVRSDLKDIAQNVAIKMNTSYPGTKTLTLDGGFPYFASFPLLPHLSHHDGKKLDFTFYYQDAEGEYLPGQTPSPIGYFGFTQGPTECPQNWLTLRWDLRWLQGFLPEYQLDEKRTEALVKIIAAELKVSKLLLEPHLKKRLNIQSEKVRFQGCRAARHDDHVHIQL